MRTVLVVLVLLFVAVGCSAEGVPVAAPDAMSIVWEETYGMDRATRPDVVFHDECRVSDGAGPRATTIGHGCVQAIVYADGRIEIQSAPLFSTSTFAFALDQWKQMLLTSEFRTDGVEVQRANNNLRAAGL
jgi:hypothetical protein